MSFFLSFVFSMLESARNTHPIPIAYEMRESVIITNTSLGQLVRPSEWVNILFDESNHNPYIFGWEEDRLYFKNGWGETFVWESGESRQKAFVHQPSFLRQEIRGNTCKTENQPTYDARNFSLDGTLRIGCTRYIQGNVSVELWPKQIAGGLAAQVKHIVIEKDNKKIIITEPRVVSDVVISKDGTFVALTASDPQRGFGTFAATNVHVLELP